MCIRVLEQAGEIILYSTNNCSETLQCTVAINVIKAKAVWWEEYSPALDLLLLI